VVTPADWQEVRLGEVLDYEQPTKYLVSSRDYVEGGMVPVLTAGKSFLLGYTDDLVGIYSDLPTIIFDDFTTATQWVDFDFKVKSSACKMLKPKRGACDLRYVYERLRALNYRTSDHKRHWISVFHTMEMRMPPLMEQEAIAETLSDADAAIESLDALIAKKRDVKQAAMQQLLTGRTRLPGFTANWKEVRLGDLGTCIRGVSYKGDSDLSNWDTPTTVRLLRSNNVQNSLIQFNDVQYVNHECVSDAQILRRDDIVICMANGSKALVGKSGLFKGSSGFDYTFGAFMGCFRSSLDRANPLFVRYLLLTKQYQDFISNILAGSSINNLTPKSIESLCFKMPKVKEQEAIAEALSVMDDELETLTEQVLKLRMVKEGMMQDLLTGKVRLV